MRVVLAHTDSSKLRDLRQMLLGAGLSCEAEDCCSWQNLGVRLAQRDTDLIVVATDCENGADWKALQESISLTMAPIMVIGPTDNSQLAEQAREAGIQEVVDQATLPASFDSALQRMNQSATARKQRGLVVSVFAPAAGSGGSTIAANLAGAFLRKHPESVGLIEMSHEAGDLALMLDATPEHLLADVCRRSDSLDDTSLSNSFFKHSSGVHLLPTGEDQEEEDALTVEATRRIAVLSRVCHQASVLALDSRVGPCEIEAMRLSDHVLIVVRADVPAVRRTQKAILQLVEQGVPKERFRLVVNRWGQGGQVPLKQIETSLKMEVFQSIPDDPSKVNKSANRGVLLHEQARLSTICRRFSALAAALEKTTTGQL